MVFRRPILTIPAALVGLSLVWLTFGCSASEQSSGARVAEAADQSQAFYNATISAYKSYYHLTWGPRQIRDPSNPREFVESTFEATMEREVIPPDRFHQWLQEYEVLDNGVRVPVGRCQGSWPDDEAIVIENRRFERQCDGSWQASDSEAVVSIDTSMTYLDEYWSKLKELKSVRRTGEEQLRGVSTDIFEGEFVDAEGAKHQIRVWIGQQDDLVRKLQDKWPSYSVDIEHYDINDPSIVVEPPQ